jgi:predicted HicB family RNase H-like nuclease
MIEYKGYVARVEFAESADVFHGRVVNSGPYPIVAFESTRASLLRREFEIAVDEYLAVCREEGIEPVKPFSGKLNVRLGSDLHAAVALAAAEAGVSINSWIVDTLSAATQRTHR